MSEPGSPSTAVTASSAFADDGAGRALREALAAGQRDFAGLVLPVGADLRGLDLSGCDLSGASLRRARLDGASLVGTVLVEARLRRASLRGASAVRADLRGADLRGADLRDVDFTRALLCDADLIGCDARGAILEGAGISLDCRTFGGVALSGLAARQLYSLLMLARVDQPEVARQLDRLRGGLQVALDIPEARDDGEAEGDLDGDPREGAR